MEAIPNRRSLNNSMLYIVKNDTYLEGARTKRTNTLQW